MNGKRFTVALYYYNVYVYVSTHVNLNSVNLKSFIVFLFLVIKTKDLISIYFYYIMNVSVNFFLPFIEESVNWWRMHLQISVFSNLCFNQHKWFLSQYGDLKSIIVEKNQMAYLLANQFIKKLQGILYQPILGYKSWIVLCVLCKRGCCYLTCPKGMCGCAINQVWCLLVWP